MRTPTLLARPQHNDVDLSTSLTLDSPFLSSSGALLPAAKTGESTAACLVGPRSSISILKALDVQNPRQPRSGLLPSQSSGAFAEVQRRQRAALEHTLADRRHLREAMFSLSLQKEQDLTDLVRRRHGLDQRPQMPLDHNPHRGGEAVNDYSPSTVFLTSVFPERAGSISRRNFMPSMGQASVAIEKSAPLAENKSPVRHSPARKHIHDHTLWHEATKGRTQQLRFWQEFRQLAHDEMERDGFTDTAAEISSSMHGAIVDHAATDLDTAIATLVMAVRDAVMANLKLDLQFVTRVIAAVEPQLRVPNDTCVVLVKLLRHIALKSDVSDAEFIAALPRLDITKVAKHARKVHRFSQSQILRGASHAGPGVSTPQTQSFNPIPRVWSREGRCKSENGFP